MGRVCHVGRVGDGDTRGDGMGGGGVFGMARRGRGGLATNCVSYCSCAVRAARVEVMLLLETCCLSMSSCRWCYRLSETCGVGAELLQNERDLTTKWEQPWPQLVCCASIYCRVCGCVFQENGIVARSFGEEWYRLIGVRIEQGEDVNDFNL